MDKDTNRQSDIIFAPNENLFPSHMDMEIETNKSKFHNTMNQSSLVTYSKITCCICSAIIEANERGTCEACEKKNMDITAGITKSEIIQYCRTCGRYNKPPWIKCERASQTMMEICLSKIKGLNKTTKIIDSSFVWTEPHSKTIIIKVAIQKELQKSIASTDFLVTFKEEWTQCDDCKKTFTPHIWNSVVQIRQKVNHKRTFLYLEQLILKHKAHVKALNIKEHPEGVDFYFSNKSQANTFVGFLQTVMPIKVKFTRQLVSTDLKSNVANYKHTYMVEIAPVCREDLIILDEQQNKDLGGIGPILLCFKQTNRIHLINPITFETTDMEASVYFKYNFRSYIDRQCLSEFLIMSCEEEVDYKEKYLKERNEKVQNSQMDIDTNNNTRLNTTHTTIAQQRIGRILEKNDFKIVNVKCMRNNQSNKNNEIIEIRTHLGKNMRPGNVFYGYDLAQINLSQDLIDLMKNKKEKIPDVILVRKKYNTYRKIFKLRHLNMEVDEEDEKSKKKKGNKKALKKYQKSDAEQFEQDVGQIKDIRDNIDLYADEDAIKKLGENLEKMKIENEDDKDDDVDIKIADLLKLGDMTLEDKDEFPDDDEAEFKDFEKEKKPSKNNNKKKKMIGKRDRRGEQEESDEDEQ